MKHYPLLDQGIDISGLEPIDLAIVIGISVIFALIGFIFIGMYTSFIFLVVMIATFSLIRKLKSNKNRGYIARQIIYRYMRKYHKIY